MSEAVLPCSRCRTYMYAYKLSPVPNEPHDPLPIYAHGDNPAKLCPQCLAVLALVRAQALPLGGKHSSSPVGRNGN